jgi:predicted  nucleic acid-binding Zn-ribbon protein
MPHMCTRCNNVFGVGVDILNGCPVCGWKKFLFVRSEKEVKGVRDLLAGKSDSNRDSLEKMLKSTKNAKKTDSLSRKVDFPDKKELWDSEKEKRPAKKDHAKSVTPSSSKGVWEVDELLDEKVEKKIESIRIAEPGSYELNLPSLLERDELVMAVKEGTYMIDLSSAFKKSKK